MAYNQPQDSNKDKRISFLSLYSTLAPLTENAETKAFELNERLYEKYPISMQGGGNHQVSYNNRTTPPKNASSVDIKCNQCGYPLKLTRNGDAYNCPNWKDPTGAKHTYIKLVDMGKAEYQDLIDDEAHKKHYDNEHSDNIGR